MQIAQSKRLLLREFSEQDATGMYALNADSEVMAFTGDDPFESVEAAREFLRNYAAYRNSGMGRWAVIRKADNMFLGWCGLKKHPNGQVDLGYRLLRKYWARGYASEAARLSLQHGFERLHLEEIIARTHAENVASIRVALKLGMQFWKKERVEGLGEANIYRMTVSWYSANKKGFGIDS